MNCAEVNEKIELFVLGGLPKSEQVEIKAHLTTCPACNAAEAEYRLLVKEIKRDAQLPSIRLDFVRGVHSKAKAEIRSIALRSLAQRIIAIAGSVAACLFFALVIWQTWIRASWPSIPQLGSGQILQAWQHRGALSVPGSMADGIVVHGQNMYLLQDYPCFHRGKLAPAKAGGGQVYVAALDIKTGRQKWLSDIQMDSTRLGEGRGRSGTSSPQGCGYLLADDLRVYCLAPSETAPAEGGFDPVQGFALVDLVALDAANGKTLWKYPQQQASSIVPLPPQGQACPRVSGDPSSIGRLKRDDNPCHPILLPTDRICWTTNTTVHMLSCADGKPLWTRSISDGGLLSTATIVNNNLYVANAMGLYCLNITTGDESWRLAYGDWLPRSGDAVIPSRDRPLLNSADGDIYASLSLGFGSRLFCIALKEHKILWHKDVARVTHLYASGDILYLRDQDVQALDRKTGQLLWTYSATGCNPVTYTEGLAYFVDSSEQGRLVALDRYTGNKVWELTGMKSCNAFVKVDSTGFVKTHDGVVYAIIFKG